MSMALVCGMGQAMATTITFDDLTGNLTNIPDGYGGLNWSEYFYYLNGDTEGPSGYETGTVSHPNVAFNAYAYDVSLNTVSGTINLITGEFTSAWDDGNTITVMGYLNGIVVYETEIVTNTEAPILVTFNWMNINKVTFSSSSQHFVLDDLTYTTGAVATPEPASCGIWALFSGLGVFGYRRRKRSA
jgi:hypothetical protein